MSLYTYIIMDYYQSSRNKGVIYNPDIQSSDYNPSCGDEVCITGTLKNGVVEKMLFQGRGCVISQATASMLVESVTNKTINEILMLDKEYIIGMLKGIELGPVRLKCALLSLYALQDGLKKYQCTRDTECLIEQNSCESVKK